MSALLSAAAFLILLTIFLGYGWLRAQALAGRIEFGHGSEAARAWLWKSGLAFAGLLAVTLAAGGSGVIARFDVFPPPLMGFFVFMLAASAYLAFSSFGTLLVRHVPFWWLVIFQAFRIPTEFALYLGLQEGRTPVQLTFEGYNFDIVTGATALLLGLFLRKQRDPKASVRTLVTIWNIMGMGFLVIIAYIALTSMPVSFRVFMNEPSNIWVTALPYTLLPGVLVVAAITGHLLVFRRLALERRR